MSVTYSIHGRTGNNMFQAAFARLLAYKNGLDLETPWEFSDFIKMTEPKHGEKGIGPIIEVLDLYYRKDREKNKLVGNYQGKRVHCNGFFQRHEYYTENVDLIKSFFEPPPSDVNLNDICLHLRLGDYWSKKVDSVVHPQWINQCLSLFGYRDNGPQKLYVVVEDKNDAYLNYIDHYKPIYISQTASEDFNFIRQFKNVICSNSSFCWWACFIGHAKSVMTFPYWMRGAPYINLAYVPGWRPIRGTFLSSQTQKHYRKKYDNPI